MLAAVRTWSWVIVALLAVACSRDRAAPAGGGGPSRILLPPTAAALPPPTAAAAELGYVGPDACGACHQERLDSARKTSHFRTSRAADRAATDAPFGEHVMVTSPGDPDLRVVMLDDDGLWQVGLDRKTEERVSRKADVVIGSGKLGQTFLYWEGPYLYQLPATYFSPPVGWRFSPGYVEDKLDFSRPVFAQCVECHALSAQLGRPEQVYDHSYVGEVQWGVTCEKCHGPGREHVAWHEANPDAAEGRHIVAPDSLSRERRDDLCLLCHSERGRELQPAFSFRPGATLREFYAGEQVGAPKAPSSPPSSPDVHSNNQMDRLALSACYRESEDLTCVSCHDPHTYERGQVAVFNARCVACHAVATLSKSAQHDGVAACAECHMPKRITEIALRHDGEAEPRAMIRDHKVGIYPAEPVPAPSP